MQRNLRFALLSAVLLVLGLLIGPAGAQEAPSIPQTGPCAPGGVYDPACDVDHDSDVDIFDIQLAAGHWNQTGVWTSGDYWALGGNAGTTPGTNYFGTSDNQALQLRVNNSRALLIQPNVSGSHNLVGGYSGNSVPASARRPATRPAGPAACARSRWTASRWTRAVRRSAWRWISPMTEWCG